MLGGGDGGAAAFPLYLVRVLGIARVVAPSVAPPVFARKNHVNSSYSGHAAALVRAGRFRAGIYPLGVLV